MSTSGIGAHPDGETYDDLHERILKFMGAFASMQFSMDTAVESLLRKRLPVIGPVLISQFMSRQRDDQRLSCFLAFVEETGYARDLAPLPQIYERAKQTRDLIGHSLNVLGPVHQVGGVRIVGVTRLYTTKNALVPSPLVPSTFDRLTNDCEWVHAHAIRALYEADVTKFITFAGEDAEPPIPSVLPVDGEPLKGAPKKKARKRGDAGEPTAATSAARPVGVATPEPGQSLQAGSAEARLP